MQRKPTEDEITQKMWEQERLSRAVKWNAHLRLSPTEVFNEERNSLDEAFEAARELDKKSTYGREALVYAITPEGDSVHVVRPEHAYRYRA